MNRASGADSTGNRIGSFCFGSGVMVLFTVLGWLSFALATTMVNPHLRGRGYWDAVADRFANSSTLTTMMALSCLFAGAGLVMMARAVLYRSAAPEE